MISEEHLNKLRSTRSADEWNKVCDEIKLAYGGYPSDWWAKVMQSGLAADAQMNWL